jgi:transcriptional regulator with XRE-family HTH domain
MTPPNVTTHTHGARASWNGIVASSPATTTVATKAAAGRRATMPTHARTFWALVQVSQLPRSLTPQNGTSAGCRCSPGAAAVVYGCLMSDTNVTAGDAIRARRQALGLTIAELAAAAGVGWSTIHRAEKGRPLSTDNAVAISRALSWPGDAIAHLHHGRDGEESLMHRLEYLESQLAYVLQRLDELTQPRRRAG